MRSEPWGRAQGRPVERFTLTNANGLMARVIRYGGILTEMHVPDRGGETADVVLGLGSLEAYLAGHPMFGAIAGRVANRIAHGRFERDGKTYELARNHGRHHLHGGEAGFDKKVWDAALMETPGGEAVELTRTSPDGEEGYPGALAVAIRYTLSDANELRIDYTASTDAPTLVNLTNHTYWNLAGHDGGDVLGHELELFADRYTPADAEQIPTGRIEPVRGTPFDFTTRKRIGADLDEASNGYDVNFEVRGEPGRLRPAARLREPKSGRVMEVSTTQPGVQLYTAGNLRGPIEGKGGVSYHRFHGVCLETQHYPDAIHHPAFPSIVLRPGETYRHAVVYRFAVD